MQRQVRCNHLHGLAIDLGEAGSQGLVAGHERLETLFQCVGVERPTDSEERRIVVRGARRGELLQEPEPLLGEGERHDGSPGPGGDGQGRGSRGGGRLLAPSLAHQGRQPGQRGMGEEGAQGDFHLEVLAYPRHHLHGAQRVPSQREEVIVAPDTVQGEALLPEGRQRLLRGGAWGDELLSQLRTRPIRQRQGPAVHLAVGIQGQGIQHDEEGRHHVRRQLARQELSQRRDGRSRTRLRDDVGHELLVASTEHTRRDDDLPHLRVVAEHGFDLADLDPEAANLDLVIDAAEEVEESVGEISNEVSRLVEPGSRLLREGVGDEALRRELRSAPVPSSEAFSADVELARYTARNGPQVPIEHVDLHVPDGLPERHGGGALWHLRDGVEVGEDSGLGGAVPVEETGAPFLESHSDPVGIQGVAGGDHDSEGWKRKGASRTRLLNTAGGRQHTVMP